MSYLELESTNTKVGFQPSGMCALNEAASTSRRGNSRRQGNKLTEKTVDAEAITAEMTPDEALQTEAGSIVGTVAYMSPEQIEGGRVDGRSDIFSFGSVLYEMVTGRRPFEGVTRISTLSAILHEEPRPLGDQVPDVPAELEKIISRCLRKDLERRAQHAADIRVALEEVRADSASHKLSPAWDVGGPGIATPGEQRSLMRKLFGSAAAKPCCFMSTIHHMSSLCGRYETASGSRRGTRAGGETGNEDAFHECRRILRTRMESLVERMRL